MIAFFYVIKCTIPINIIPIKIYLITTAFFEYLFALGISSSIDRLIIIPAISAYRRFINISDAMFFKNKYARIEPKNSEIPDIKVYSIAFVYYQFQNIKVLKYLFPPEYYEVQ